VWQQSVNPLFAKFFRSIYHKEPISGFILVLGATDALIGGVGGRWSLLSIGLVIALLGIVMRWQQGQKSQKAIATEPIRHLLPPTSSPPPLPLLMSNKPPR